MTPERAVQIIERAWSVYRGVFMAEQEARHHEVSWSDMYPERPVDYEGVEEVETYYRDLYMYGQY